MDFNEDEIPLNLSSDSPSTVENIPNDIQLYLEFKMFNDEQLLYIEKPKKREISKRNLVFISLSMIVLFILPIVSISFALVSFITLLENSEGLFMLCLGGFDIVLLIIWLLYVRTLNECYVVTNKRLMIIRNASFGGLCHVEVYIDQLANNHHEIIIQQYKDGSGNLKLPKFCFEYISDNEDLEEALSCAMGRGVSKKEDPHNIVIKAWIYRIVSALVLCFILSICLPYFIHWAAYFNYDSSLRIESSSSPHSSEYMTSSSIFNSIDTKAKINAFFWGTGIIVFVSSFIITLYFLIRGIKGLQKQIRLYITSQELDDFYEDEEYDNTFDNVEDL
eukprot:TRINITY_DN10759_c0_g4_i1.p1 TRINITY_DN10759_c0_g4~~TRINITY_DN10759_c0_g4_i1.p1  ORF type:complete len:334 (+),score=68.71 TRINITY_DN10759_c0_g4_i1:51-1052(+)